MKEKQKGTVKFYNINKAYGFIVGDDDKDYFFHLNYVIGQKILKKDDRVVFNSNETEKGIEARKVEVI
jgi:CspA family cold shock protein